MSDRIYTYLAGEDILLFKRRYTAFQEKTHRSFAGSWMAGFLLLLFTLTACVGEELQKPLLGEGEGYLTLQIDAISAEVTSSTLTKATISTPIIDDLMINIKQSNGFSVDGFPKKYTDLPKPLVLKANTTYTVEAYHGDNNDIQTTPYFYGSSKVTIEALKNTSTSFEVKLANAMLVPVVDKDLQDHYQNWTLSVTVGSNPAQALATDKMTQNLFVKEGASVQVTFNGTNLLNGVTNKQTKVTDAAQACTQYTIQCNPENLPEFTLETTATAKHTENGGKLDGTRVQVYATKLEGTPQGLITGWKAELYNANNTLVRTYSASSAPTTNEKNDMLAESGWPYLPQGEYTLRSTLTLLTGESTTEHVTTIIVPKPEFTVTASAYTSYNKYTNGDIDGANTCDGSTIYAMQAVPTIAPELLENTNYTQSSELYIGSEKVTDPTSKVLSWGTHTLTASYTFDGATYSGSGTYHVTGLPYEVSFQNNAKPTNWSFNNSAEGGADKYLVLKVTEAHAISPKFHIAQELGTIQTNAYLQAYAYGGTVPYKYTASVIISSSSGDVVKSGEITKSIEATGVTPNVTSRTDINKALPLTQSTPYVSIYTKGNEPSGLSTGSLDFGLVCFQFKLHYK